MSSQWIPDECTLPTVDRPLRLTEFDRLLGTALLGQDRTGPTTLRWRLDPAAEPAVRDLASREAACCSFFGFTVARSGDALTVEICVPAERVAVLDALQRTAGMSAVR